MYICSIEIKEITTHKKNDIMTLIIYYKGELLEFLSVEAWNIAIMSILFDNTNLTCVKDGLGGCIIQ